MKVFQRDFLSSTVASVDTWENEWQVSVIIHYHRTGRENKEAYISFEHICGFSILYPALRAPKSSWLLKVGYGVPPRYKEKSRSKKKLSLWDSEPKGRKLPFEKAGTLFVASINQRFYLGCSWRNATTYSFQIIFYDSLEAIIMKMLQFPSYNAMPFFVSLLGIISDFPISFTDVFI